MRALAKRLLAVEAASSAPDAPPPAVRVFQRLRAYLTRLIGPDGFIALQQRALFLARAEIPSLHTVEVTEDGRLEGIEASNELHESGEAATAITAHVLQLLIVLIGESLTRRLMLDAFPNTSGTMIGESEDLS